jgi:uncharacterized protein GlcG (DUF336 family)
VPQLIQTRTVSRELARIGIERAVEQSEAIGCRTCIAVIDVAGNLVSYDRMDGAPYNSAQHAQDKAVSSAGNGVATHDMWAYVANDPQLNLGILKVQGFSVLGGGVPIHLDGELLGAVGVSGSCGMAEDQAVAEAAVAAILDALQPGRPVGPRADD